MRGGKKVRERYRYKHRFRGKKRTVVRKGKKVVRRIRKIRRIRRVRRRTARQRWRVKRTNNPQTWWSYRLRINRWRFSRRMTRTQAFWYLRRYSDVRKRYGARNWRGARKHWREFGIKERRNKLAYRDLNAEESKIYIDRF